MKIKLKDKRILNIILAWFVAFVLFNLGGFVASDILLAAIMLISFLILEKNNLLVVDASKVVNTTSAILTAIFSVLYILYSGDKMTAGLENFLFKFVFFISTSIGITCIFYVTIRYILFTLSKKYNDVDEAKKLCPIGTFNCKTWLLFSGVIFLCMLPLFFLNFPGTMTVDSFDQLSQAMGLDVYSDHHPWVHTLLIELMYGVGFGIFKNATIGIATYTLFQMVIMALSVGYSIASMEEMGASRKWQYLIFLAFILFPYNLAYAITMWKDILFSAAVLVLIVTVYRLVMVDFKKSISIRDCVLFVVSGIGMCLLRHNGLYAFIVAILVIIIWLFIKARNNEKDKHVFISTLISYVLVLLIVVTVKGPIQNACGVEAGDYAHNLAIPLQQIGRVVSHNGDISINEIEDLEKINSIIYIKNNYMPGGADNMIQWLAAGDSKYFEENKGHYLAIWVSIGLKNPRAYLEAFFDQTKGYYTTMMPEQIAYYGILPNHMNLDGHPLIGATKRIKINEILSKLQDVIPVYGIMYSTGAVLQLIMLAIGVEICSNRRKMLLIYLPIIMLLATVLIATPLVADLRYGYTLLLVFPTLLTMTLGIRS